MSQTGSSHRKLILLLGGARAGKSTMALRLARDYEGATGAGVCFIATAQALDQDMNARIERHRAERPAHWRTVEEPYQIDEALRQADQAGIVIVDCLTLFVTNWLLRSEDEHQCEQSVRLIIRNFLETAAARRQRIICVSNEVGLGIVPESQLGRVFRDLIGCVHQDLAAAADEEYLVVAGLPLLLKPGQ